MEIQVINNKDLLRFEVSIHGELAMLTYRFYKNNLALMHTSVPQSMKGQGIGTKLVLAAIDFAVEQNKKLMLYCSFAAKLVKEHKEFHKYADTDFHPSLKDSFKA
jgi:predicted GNAT family acetyltransferase